ncbi:MAG: VWA domain-containing protein [Byssovorax sp.]
MVLGESSSLWARGLSIAALIAAPFLPPIKAKSDTSAVVYVVDRSTSVGEAGRSAAEDLVREAFRQRGSTQVGLVAFAAHPEILIPVGEDRPVPVLTEAPDGSGSDIGGAIRLAAAALPSSGRRRIVLLSDGRATAGDALAEVRAAEREGITVDTVAVGTTLVDTPVVAEVSAREPRVAEGEPVSVTARLRGRPSATHLLRWTRDGREVKRGPITLDPYGVAEATYSDARPGSGVHVYEAALLGVGSDDDDAASITEGHRGLAAVSVGGKPRVLVMTIDGACPGVLDDALARSEIDKQIVTLGDQPFPDAATLSGADLVVLADVPLAPVADAATASGLTPKDQEALLDYAQKGGGVLVTGGAFGFSPEYGSAPIARMLPVEIEDQGQVEDPKAAMAIMLDRSGSMGAMVGAHTKIQLAVEAALAAASTLRPDDILALGSVDEKTHWNEPLGPVSELEKRKKEIRSIDAGGGGIYVYTALADAYGVLKGAGTAVRHVILFADTADSEEQTESCYYSACGSEPRTAIGLAELARKTGITTSVVGIGLDSDCDYDFLRKLAAAAGGRFYLTSDAADLRRIFISEARVAARSNLREGPVPVRAADAHPLLAGVDVSALPALGGFVEAKRRPLADNAILTRDEDKPILSSWRYGLGQVVALTTDLRGDWKGSWSRMPMAGQVLRQTVRFAMRRHGAANAEMRVAVHGRAAEATLEMGEGAGEPGAAPAQIEAFAYASNGAPQPVPVTLERTAPGRYTARARMRGEPFLIVRARDAGGGLVAEAIGTSDSAGELAAVGSDDRALRDLAREGDGMFGPDPAETLRAEGPSRGEPVPLWPFVLLGAALLVCVDLWLRRLGRRRVAALLPSLGLPAA